ncbi:MAG: hypothetical protein WBS54_03590 [Acidobacteriota bacterium]
MSGKTIIVLSLVLCFVPMCSMRAALPSLPGAWVIPARALEEHAEDSIDVLTARRVDAAKMGRQTAQMEAMLNRLKMASNGNAEASRQASRAEECLKEMKEALAGEAYVKAALAANRITMVMLPIEGFPTPEHREVALLDCLSREITLLNEDDTSSRAPLLKERRDQIEATWNLLRPWYAAKKGTRKLMADVDACVARIISATGAEQQIAEGQRLGDLVDAMERYLPRMKG